MEKGRNTKLQVDLFYYDMTKCNISARLLCLLQKTKRGGETEKWIQIKTDGQTGLFQTKTLTSVATYLLRLLCHARIKRIAL